MTQSQIQRRNRGNSQFKSSMMNPQQEMQAKLIAFTQSSEIIEIQNLLTQQKSINLIEIFDFKKNTLLHKAVINSKIEIVKIYVEYQKDYEFAQLKGQASEEGALKQQGGGIAQIITGKIRSWVNQQNDEGFAPIHFASFRGNVQIMSLLLECGADIELRNLQGLNVIHIAAQADQPRSLCYFKLKNMDMESEDNRGGTPLHWAASQGCDNSVNFLCAWKVKLDSQDVEGATPLHLSVQQGNSRVVRKLLIKGSNRSIQDNYGKTPMQYAAELGFNNISDMLDQRPSLAEWCNIKTAFKPLRKKKRTLLLFSTMYVVGCAIFIVFLFPLLRDWECFISGSLFICTMLLFLCAVLKDPGYIENNMDHPDILLELTKTKDPAILCPECIIEKPLRSRHCEICKRCVGVYDHHCPWINNCVGRENHRYFFSYVGLCWVSLVYILFYTLYHCFDHYSAPINSKHFRWFNAITDKAVLQKLFYAKEVFSTANIVFSLMFLIPLSILFWVQLNNFLFNQTTFERFSSNKKQMQSQTSSSNNSDSEIAPSFVDQNRQQQLNVSLRSKGNFNEKSLENCRIMCYENEDNIEYDYHYVKDSD